MTGDRITFTAGEQTFTGRVTTDAIEDGGVRPPWRRPCPGPLAGSSSGPAALDGQRVSRKAVRAATLVHAAPRRPARTRGPRSRARARRPCDRRGSSAPASRSAVRARSRTASRPRPDRCPDSRRSGSPGRARRPAPRARCRPADQPGADAHSSSNARAPRIPAQGQHPADVEQAPQHRMHGLDERVGRRAGR